MSEAEVETPPTVSEFTLWRAFRRFLPTSVRCPDCYAPKDRLCITWVSGHGGSGFWRTLPHGGSHEARLGAARGVALFLYDQLWPDTAGVHPTANK
jgi:hypothetical protein